LASFALCFSAEAALEAVIATVQPAFAKTSQMLSSESANIAYNKLLIEKAVMVKELETLEENKFKKFWQKLLRKATNKKLISDYF